MVSTKFKPGQKVYYSSAYSGMKIYGIVVGREEAQKEDKQLFTPSKLVWARWDNNNTITYIEEADVYLAEPRYERRLPKWWLMIKKGDWVYLLYPERSKWDDTMQAIRDGTLKKGKKYQVLKVFNGVGGYGKSVTLDIKSEDNPLAFYKWNLGIEAVSLIPKESRKLPKWF